MPLEGFRQMTLTSIPKLPNGEKSGFQLDCEAICQVTPYLKQLLEYEFMFEDENVNEELVKIIHEVEKFVSVFYPPDDIAPEPDDLPKFDIVQPMNRQARRAAKRATFRPGEGWSNAS